MFDVPDAGPFGWLVEEIGGEPGHGVICVL